MRANASPRIALFRLAQRSATIAARCGRAGRTRIGRCGLRSFRAEHRSEPRTGTDCVNAQTKQERALGGEIARAREQALARLFGIGGRRPRAPEPDQRRLDERLHASGSPLTSAW